MKYPWIHLLALTQLVACNRSADLDTERGAPPPPAPSARAGTCRDGGGKVSDAPSAGFFPRQVAGFCIDPNADARAFGAEATANLDKVCLEQFNGDCEVYKSYGLQRVVTLRYVDGGASAATVDVVLSRFSTTEGAYGFFTRRLVGGADPVTRAPEVLAAGAVGGIGSGSASVWRGGHVVELVYSNPDETPQRSIELAQPVLAALGKQLGDRLPGELALPAAARALPEENRVPFGISYELGELLGVSGTGAGAHGFYRRGEVRWRVVSIERPDEAGANDVIATLQKAFGAKTEKGLAFKALRFTTGGGDSEANLEWFMARSDRRVFAVGDEEHVADPQKSAEDLARLSLSRSEKLELLGRLVQSPEAVGAKPAGPKAEP